MTVSSANERLAAARAAYAERARSQCAAVRRLAAELPDPGALQALRQLGHRLHGTAGSYGFTDVSSAAARLEQASTSTSDIASLRKLADDLARALEGVGTNFDG